MARAKGVSTFVKIPLSELNRVLGEFPNVKIAVGKGNIAELESALDVDFGLSEDEVSADAVDSKAVKAANADEPLAGMDVQ